ncbi:MAG: ParB N-terminal domain-containing protein [Chromatiaceae bacterium]|nr:ParB N-terminal domain-containing protein [Chromatiaceae bacterium]MBP6807834.1 ParB N-terminal domain-containing protein [Chromatiaceae bacterium]MBP8290489.1 ParB N-terminal domain-containing protein [Chromatiaceae bacterium]
MTNLVSPRVRVLPSSAVEPWVQRSRTWAIKAARMSGSTAQGVIEPLIVSLHPETPGRYLLVAWERRWRAAGMAGLTTVAVIHAQHIEAPTRRLLCEFASRIGSRSPTFRSPRRWPGGLSEARRTGPRTRPTIGAWSPR